MPLELGGADPQMVPIVFGPPRRRLVGFYHPPGIAPSRGLGVVLCNPIGHEAMSGQRTYRHLAERLAARGFAALRFDYDGTGDSTGQSDDGDRVQAWLDSVEAAIQELLVLADGCRIGLFGARFGGTLAALAAAKRGGVDCLIPWGPIVSGRKHVRELRAFRLLRTRRASADVAPDGSEEVGGYYFGKQTLADIGAIDLLSGTDHIAKRALVLDRDRPGGEEADFGQHLGAHGTDVRLVGRTGYARMMRDDPYESEVPFETLETIVDWLDECRYPETRPPAPRARSAESFSVAIRGSPAVIHETPLVFGKDHRLFGVLSEPDHPVPPHRPALCLLNVGANPHVGPQRMNVDLARELASAGYLAFRFDAAGLGESRGPPGAPENRIYTLDAIADVASAMTLLGRLRGSRKFVLVGLCSGAYLAYHTAIVDERVAGQVLINPYAFEWKEGDPVAPRMREAIHSTRFYVRALLDPGIWLRALRGDVNALHIARLLLERFNARMDSALPAISARLRGRLAPTNAIERAFSMLCDRGVESALVSSFDDGGIDMVAGYLGTDARKMRRRKNFTFEIVNADHTFATIASQELLRSILRAYVDKRFP
jgi:alpha-beta hydrolase superfamily lysophospholipase